MERNKKKNITQTKRGSPTLSSTHSSIHGPQEKTIGLGALGGGASYGVKKALEAATRKRRKN